MEHVEGRDFGSILTKLWNVSLSLRSDGVGVLVFREERESTCSTRGMASVRGAV